MAVDQDDDQQPPRPAASAPRTAEPGPLGRWSRRKAQVQAAAEQAEREQAEAEAARAAAEQRAAREQISDADLPPVESLTEDSDYRPFLSPKVSAELRRAALRRLFRGAGFQLRDGLDDYDEDFTRFTPLGDIVTADMRHRMEMEAQRRSDQDKDSGEPRPTATAQAEAAPAETGPAQTEPEQAAASAPEPPPAPAGEDRSPQRTAARSPSDPSDDDLGCADEG